MTNTDSSWPMITLKKITWFLFLSVSVLTACSTTNQTTSSSKSHSGVTHAAAKPWYKQSGSFQAGQNGYLATATGISSDSLRALYRAGQTAMADMRTGLQQQLEDLRIQLVDQKVKAAGKPAFIWLMRGAIPSKMIKAKKTRSIVISHDGIYQAYVQVKYPKTDLVNDLLNTLSVDAGYVNDVKNATAFKSWQASQVSDSTRSTM